MMGFVIALSTLEGGYAASGGSLQEISNGGFYIAINGKPIRFAFIKLDDKIGKYDYTTGMLLFTAYLNFQTSIDNFIYFNASVGVAPYLLYVDKEPYYVGIYPSGSLSMFFNVSPFSFGIGSIFLQTTNTYLFTFGLHYILSSD